MNTRDPGKPGGNEHQANEDQANEAQTYEARINALLEGKLSPAEAEALKAAAREDSRLAQAIVDAWQLQESLDQLAVEKAPASLSLRLKRIPHEHGANDVRAAFGLPGWALSVGVVAVAAVALALIISPQQRTPLPEAETANVAEVRVAEVRVAEARRDLAIAFSYLDKVGLRTTREIRSVLNEELASPVKDNLSKHLPYMAHAPKEKHA